MNGMDVGRWDWLLLSVAVATLASLAYWLLAYTAAHPRVPAAVAVVKRVVDSPWITQPLRLAYAVGLPAVLLFSLGALTTRGLGLKPLPTFSPLDDLAGWSAVQWTEWAGDIGWAVLVSAITFLLVGFGDRVARQGAPVERRSRHDLAISLREAVYYQVHWAFYRESFVVMWGMRAGSWLGALPVALEALLNPMLWERMRGDDRVYARQVVVRGGLYAATTLIFLQTQNLWVALVADAALGWILLPVPLAAPVPAPADTPTIPALTGVKRP